MSSTRGDLSRGHPDALSEAVDIPLYVVTARHEAHISGCLAGFVTQSSIDPVRYVVCISRKNHTYEVARRSKGLAIHLLGADQCAMASLFGEESSDVIDKFASVRWAEGLTGAPLLHECAAWAEGPIISRLEGGDHEAFLVEIATGGDGSAKGQLMQSDVSEFTAGHPA